jgi:hypothetical protein
MNVKGTVYTTTKATIIEAFGEQRWNSFMAKLAEKDNYFKNNIIMAVTLVPQEKIIIFFDELINEFFYGNKESYVMFGMVGAKYGLSPKGPYSSFLLTKDVKKFIESALPKLWETYYDAGKVTTRLENNIVYIKITGFTIKHYYFEKLLMGFFKQTLKAFGKKSVATMVRSLTMGNDDMLFKYELKDS